MEVEKERGDVEAHAPRVRLLYDKRNGNPVLGHGATASGKARAESHGCVRRLSFYIVYCNGAGAEPHIL